MYLGDVHGDYPWANYSIFLKYSVQIEHTRTYTHINTHIKTRIHTEDEGITERLALLKTHTHTEEEGVRRKKEAKG